MSAFLEDIGVTPIRTPWAVSDASWIFVSGRMQRCMEVETCSTSKVGLATLATWWSNIFEKDQNTHTKLDI